MSQGEGRLNAVLATMTDLSTLERLARAATLGRRIVKLIHNNLPLDHMR